MVASCIRRRRSTRRNLWLLYRRRHDIDNRVGLGVDFILDSTDDGRAYYG
jgi:hypothetical protein